MTESNQPACGDYRVSYDPDLRTEVMNFYDGCNWNVILVWDGETWVPREDWISDHTIRTLATEHGMDVFVGTNEESEPETYVEGWESQFLAFSRALISLARENYREP